MAAFYRYICIWIKDRVEQWKIFLYGNSEMYFKGIFKREKLEENTTSEKESCE